VDESEKANKAKAAELEIRNRVMKLDEDYDEEQKITSDIV
jgi:hypothetical protein